MLVYAKTATVFFSILLLPAVYGGNPGEGLPWLKHQVELVEEQIMGVSEQTQQIQMQLDEMSETITCSGFIESNAFTDYSPGGFASPSTTRAYIQFDDSDCNFTSEPAIFTKPIVLLSEYTAEFLAFFSQSHEVLTPLMDGTDFLSLTEGFTVFLVGDQWPSVEEGFGDGWFKISWTAVGQGIHV